MRKYQMLILAAVVLISVWMASSFAANSYDVVVGPQKSDMQRMIEAYERLSAQYLVVVQDNLALMANQDRLILERLATVEKKLDSLAQKLDTMQTQPVKSYETPKAAEQTQPMHTSH